MVSFPFMVDEYGYDILLGLGDACQCVSPPEVRVELQRRLSAMLRNYALDKATEQS